MTSFWTGTRVRLRGIEPEDWPAFRQLAEDEEGLGDLPGPPRSAEAHRSWAREQATAASDGDRFQLAVQSLESGDAVGAVGSHRADPRTGCFEYGISIATAHRRKGYATEAAVLVLRHMFAERRYHKCEARILAHNEGSLALHHALGFVEEGRLRDHVFHEGRHRDMVLMGMLAGEFTGLYSLER